MTWKNFRIEIGEKKSFLVFLCSQRKKNFSFFHFALFFQSDFFPFYFFPCWKIVEGKVSQILTNIPSFLSPKSKHLRTFTKQTLGSSCHWPLDKKDPQFSPCKRCLACPIWWPIYIFSLSLHAKLTWPSNLKQVNRVIDLARDYQVARSSSGLTMAFKGRGSWGKCDNSIRGKRNIPNAGERKGKKRNNFLCESSKWNGKLTFPAVSQNPSIICLFSRFIKTEYLFF